jgi:hypothetical protein
VTSDFSHVVGDVAYSRGKIHRTVALPDIVVRAFERHRTRQSERRLAAGGLWQPSDFTFTTAMGRPLEGTLVTRDLKQRAVDSRLSTGGRARGGRSAAQGRLRLGNCSPFPSRHVRYVVKTKPVSTHRSPALRRRSFSRVLWTFSAETHTAGRIRGSPFVRRLPYGTYRSRQRHGGCEKEPRRLTRPSDRELDTVLRCYRLATRTPISSQSNKVPRAVRAARRPRAVGMAYSLTSLRCEPQPASTGGCNTGICRARHLLPLHSTRRPARSFHDPPAQRTRGRPPLIP